MTSSDRDAPQVNGNSTEVEHYRRVRALFEELTALPGAERRARLEQAREQDGQVAQEVAELMALETEATLDLGVRLEGEGDVRDGQPTMELPSRIGRYEIRSLLGKGGMGSVFRAWDASLEREVALKILPSDVATAPDRLERFEREAKTLAALQHAGVVTVYSVEQDDGRHFFTMELVEGRSLAQRIPDGGLPVETFHRWALELVDALAAAHAAGIVHRDLKPANVLVNEPGESIRLVDFGLVKRVSAHGEDHSDAEKATAAGLVMGTWSYMSPEQARGEAVDQRTDVFSLGVVFYEMLTGVSPFKRSSAAESMVATLNETQSSIRSVRPAVPKRLATVINRCLEKNPDDRFQDAAAVKEALLVLLPEQARWPRWVSLAATAAALVVLSMAAIAWWSSRAEGQLAASIQRIEELQTDRRQWDAYVAARELLATNPGNPSATRLLRELSVVTDIETDPPGASVALRAFDDLNGDWIQLGTTPIKAAAFPNDVLVLRAELPGWAPAEVQYAPRRGAILISLQKADEVPSGMIRIPAGQVALWQQSPVAVASFWMDRTEVSNADYQAFVHAGGYTNEDFWPGPILFEGEPISFPEVRKRFVDQTGRPGPSTWSAGTFAEGEADLPVHGVSWFEARAFAAYSGKTLPTIYHWRQAAPERPSDHMARLANFNSDGPADVGSVGALSPTGVHDLAGNVAEWLVNAAGGERYMLGGSWRDPRYSFGHEVRRSPWARGETLGFRCVLLPEELDPFLSAPIELERFDFGSIDPVSDEVFAAFKSSYDADPVPLDARVESSDETSPHWIRQKVNYAASYGGERIPAHLFLPRRARPPFQAVVYFPSASAFGFASSDQLADLPIVDFLPRNGRAFLVPVLKGLYERREPLRGPNGRRRRLVEIVQDVRKSVDYLETRDDIDSDRIAYASISLGSTYGPLALALEPRFKAAVLIAGGFHDDAMLGHSPMVQSWNYASRAKTPVLMINGRGDNYLPIDTGQRPMFEMFAAPAEDKRHVVMEGGSLPDDQNAIARETLDWLDRYLGPVVFADS